MGKKCINCKHLRKGRYYTYCELVPQDRIEKKQMYQFVKCNTFREKEYTGIPDSLWKLPIEVKSIKKKIRDLTVDELINLCKNQKHQCDNCPAYYKEAQCCGVVIGIKIAVLNNEVDIHG